MIEKSSPEFAELLGCAIVALSRYFCGVIDREPPPGGVIYGRSKLDPVYMAVTEGRDGPTPEARRKYSSCGDQLHAILDRIGVHEPFVNRKSQHGRFAYGENITRLQRPACEFASTAPRAADYRPPAGALCLVWNSGLDAHALVALGQGSDAGHILTGNYGAGGMSPSTEPGASLADSPIQWDGRALRVGAARRILHTVITPAAIVPYISAQIDLSGAPVTGELVDALGARYE